MACRSCARSARLAIGPLQELVHSAGERAVAPFLPGPGRECGARCSGSRYFSLPREDGARREDRARPFYLHGLRCLSAWPLQWSALEKAAAVGFELNANGGSVRTNPLMDQGSLAYCPAGPCSCTLEL
jgi:hypothetical protein